MLSRQKFMLAIALTTLAVSAKADSFAYVISGDLTGSGQFGTVNLATGAYQQIGPIEPDGYFGLAPGPNGTLLSLTYAGNLDSINPATGVPTRIGPTGLGSCVVPAPSCGPTSAFSLGRVNGKIYATDFNNDLYIVNPVTGVATLLSQHTGIPPAGFVLGSQNPDGTLNFADEAIWGSGGNLYVTFDAITFSLDTFSVASVKVPAMLYQINPETGVATAIGPTDLGFGGATVVNGTTYAFSDSTNQISTLNLSTGQATPVGFFDPSAGVIQGAVAVIPEPASLMLASIGIAGLVVLRRRRAFTAARPSS